MHRNRVIDFLILMHFINDFFRHQGYDEIKLVCYSSFSCTNIPVDGACDFYLLTCKKLMWIGLNFNYNNVNFDNACTLQPKPLKNLNGQICQICGDTVGLTATGDVFVACNECAFPFCHRCYEYEPKNGNQSCPQCKTRFRSPKGSPRVEGDADEDDVDGPENEFNYGLGNTKARQQWEEDADLSSSSGQDSQQPIPHLANGQLISGENSFATPDTKSVRTTSGALGTSERVHSLPFIDPRQPGLESDEEIRRVPEIGGESAGTSASRPDTGSIAGPERVQGTGEGQRKRGRSPADKESKRLKRLLRNRVSAQQARERKKAYLNDLETRVKDLEKKNSELKERLSTLQNENQMLRQILKNTTASRRGSTSGSNAEGT